MAKIILITGGARSGKSTFAQEIISKKYKNILYIATAIPFDAGMKDRIKKHQEMRSKTWKTIEQYKNFENIERKPEFLNANGIIFECITLMITNILMDEKIDFENIDYKKLENIEEKIIKEVEVILDLVRKYNKYIVIVTNEVGMGIVPAYMSGNIFRDIAGRVNQYIAKRADEVYITISGIPLKLK
ncbi:cobinamide kinase [Marinitoga sp. 1135]|uniref:Adenosylcobinamide kinase n=1 Tax=Marinitoga piezophila (strain DSM 14283 / JCM 11233 / KA3) TaxID=443254 RepID=H2J517_MARPK|nr:MULTISPECIES: bifunctional adenosylcobinamide kinase/adenosylcobinamide-phosphate guanylyltransferase [Marinitoga]AEX86034.1 adenosyl cobinamide kinase/adenosyl cobinamide phosphate guanylyltransferase [Marinitoga piezophila KA3]APT76458.1 cobinamide kinase [Marinitoga sp. 1137]NUU96219.1 cobinamide kinase [Marinitoga sp. 1135]NUU98142.1 cobinamide kinase [Marinitoga sp. 1138]